MYVEQEERKVHFQQLALERKILRDTSNPFGLDYIYFKKYYRFTPEVALNLVQLLEGNIIRFRDTAIPPHIQILIALRFLAEGSFQRGCGQDFMHPVSQTTVSRCVNTVVDAINMLTNRFIVFPNTPAERQRVQRNFQRTIRIAGVIGLVDGFLVCFRKPHDNEEAFYNYRVGTAMNVQMISDSEYVIRGLRICPGANNDRYVWQFSEAKEHMEALRNNENIVAEEGSYYILGDSGYTPSPVLLTPILNAAEGTPAALYTQEHVKTRSQVERTIGLLTNVWKAINRTRKMYYSPDKVSKIINACAILHNIRLQHGIVDDEDMRNNNAVIDNNNAVIDNNQRVGGDYPAGIAERNRILNLYYS